MKNPQRSNQCRACEQHRKLPKWFKCSVCTYENGPGRKTCEMCDTNLKEARIKTPIPTLLGMYLLKFVNYLIFLNDVGKQ